VTRRRDDVDLDHRLYVVRDNLGRADAFLTAAEDLIERPGVVGEDEDEDEERDASDDEALGRRRDHVAHLVKSAKLAVRAAIYGGGQLAVELDRYRTESSRAMTPAALQKPRGRT
jgi:hypothetical protein